MAKPNLSSLERALPRGVSAFKSRLVIQDFPDGTWIRWTTHLVIPESGRKYEQESVGARRTLCLNPAFRLDLMKLRAFYRVDQLDASTLADLDPEPEARELCKRWGFVGNEWVSWLVKKWDPNASELSLLTNPMHISFTWLRG